MIEDTSSFVPEQTAREIDIGFEPLEPARGHFGQYWNDFRLFGRGKVLLNGDSFIVVGNTQFWPFWFSASKQLRFSRSEISWVEASGPAVRIEVTSVRDTPGGLTLWFENTDTASAFSAQLTGSVSGGLIPTRTDMLVTLRPCLEGHRSWTAYSFALASLIVFAISISSGAGWTSSDGMVQVRFGSNFGPFTTDGEWWRLLTATFVHFGALHILVNLWALLTIGATVERIFGSTRFVVLSVGSAFAGNFASVLWNPNLNSAGMSGAVLGIFGTLLAAGTSRSDWAIRTALRPLQRSTLICLIAFLAFSMTSDAVDNASHFGGLLAGLAFGLSIRMPSPEPVARTHTTTYWASLSLALVLTVFAGQWALENSTSRLHGDGLQWHVSHWIDRKEAIAVSNWNSVVQSARTGTAQDQELADRLESDVLPFWIEAQDRLSRATDDAGSSPTAYFEFLREVATRREAAVRLCVDGHREHDVTKVVKCNEAMAEIDQYILSHQAQSS